MVITPRQIKIIDTSQLAPNRMASRFSQNMHDKAVTLYPVPLQKFTKRSPDNSGRSFSISNLSSLCQAKMALSWLTAV